MFTKNSSVLKLSALISCLAGSILFSNASFGQTYYSRFANPTGKYNVVNPTGCTAPVVITPSAIADDNDDNFASFGALIASPYTCATNYQYGAALSLPNGATQVNTLPINAGWRLMIPSGITKDSLAKYVIVSTYLKGASQESNTGFTLGGVETGTSGVNWIVYLTATKAFDSVGLTVNPRIIQLIKPFEFDVYYAIASTFLLPAHIDNFKAAVSGKNVNLSWQSLTETNVDKYRIERSSDGGASYLAIASLPAKGNSNVAISYGYADALSLDGNYLYRLVVVNKDGSANTTNSITAVVNGQSSLFLYPSVVKAGQRITVKTSQTGMITVRLFDAQGREVKQQRINSTGLFHIATDGLSAGIYNVKLISATGTILKSKIVVD